MKVSITEPTALAIQVVVLIIVGAELLLMVRLTICVESQPLLAPAINVSLKIVELKYQVLPI